MQSFVLDTPPAQEPVTVAEVKEHLRIDHDDEDVLLARTITAVRKRVEQENNLALIRQIWKLYLDGFPTGFSGQAEIAIRKRPVTAVHRLTYIDIDGNSQTLGPADYDIADYEVDLFGFLARLRPAYGNFWPVTRCVPNAVEIEFTAGYGPDPEDVPEHLKQGMLLLIGHYYENREQTLVGQPMSTIQMAYESLFASERVRSI